jgi:virginiamycin B lyase
MKVTNSRTNLKVSLVLGVILLLIITSSFKPVYSYRISEYKPPSAAAGLDPRPLNIEISAQDKSKVYFTEEYTGRIGAMKVKGEMREFVEYILPFKPELGYSEPWDLSIVAPGNGSDLIFFTDYHQNQIGCLDSSSKEVWLWDIPTPGSGPRGIFAVNKDLVWFTEFYGDKIGKLLKSPTGWFIEEYKLPSGSNPLDIVCSGDAVWFTEYSRNRIGMIDATTGTLHEYYIGGSGPWGITVDPDGMVWYTVSGGSGYIGRLNPWTREVIEYKGLPTS